MCCLRLIVFSRTSIVDNHHFNNILNHDIHPFIIITYRTREPERTMTMKRILVWNEKKKLKNFPTLSSTNVNCLKLWTDTTQLIENRYYLDEIELFQLFQWKPKKRRTAYSSCLFFRSFVSFLLQSLSCVWKTQLHIHIHSITYIVHHLKDETYRRIDCQGTELSQSVERARDRSKR
jgi:hypothetical protein